jgi:Ca2+-binding RTX toxin-like protein
LIEFLVPDGFLSPGTLGQHDTPDIASPLFGFFNYEGRGWDYTTSNGGLQIGGYGYFTIVHELGHAIGLAHPHDNGGGSTIWPGVTSAFDSYGSNDLNQSIYTVMSYNTGWDKLLDPDGKGISVYGYNAGPSAFDIAAVQYLYGANNSYRTGNDTYTLPDANSAGTFWTCIWDAGGTDRIFYGGSKSVTIDLTAATIDNSPTGGGVLSYASAIQGGLTIANGVVIENAYGGFGNDIIKGNAVGNRLFGRNGNDSIDGRAGADHLEGGLGNDIYYVDHQFDSVIESSNGGFDTVRSSAAFILRSNVESLVLTSNAIYGTGNGLDNLIHGNAVRNILSGMNGADKLYGHDGNDLLTGGNGNDILDGGRGADTLYGLGGRDYFYFRNIVDLGRFTATTDIIKDFSRASGDKIHVATIDANASLSGNQTFEFIGTDPFSHAGQIRWYTGRGQTHFLLNTDSDSSYEALIRVAGTYAPDATWFVL